MCSFRWDDDVVFKNCAKGIPEKGKVGMKDVIYLLEKTLGTVSQTNIWNTLFCMLSCSCFFRKGSLLMTLFGRNFTRNLWINISSEVIGSWWHHKRYEKDMDDAVQYWIFSTMLWKCCTMHDFYYTFCKYAGYIFYLLIKLRPEK